MKKLNLLLALLLIFSSFNFAFAIDLEKISNLTDDQKTKIAAFQTGYVKQYNDNETKIMDFTNKINQIKNDSEKTSEQILLLTGAYERNLTALKAQQQQLKNQSEEFYKSVLTEEQYKQYQLQQFQVENAFNEFLKK